MSTSNDRSQIVLLTAPTVAESDLECIDSPDVIAGNPGEVFVDRDLDACQRNKRTDHVVLHAGSIAGAHLRDTNSDSDPCSDTLELTLSVPKDLVDIVPVLLPSIASFALPTNAAKVTEINLHGPLLGDKLLVNDIQSAWPRAEFFEGTGVSMLDIDNPMPAVASLPRMSFSVLSLYSPIDRGRCV